MADTQEFALQGSGSTGSTVSGGEPLAMIGSELGTSGCDLGAFWRAYGPYLASGLDAFLAFGDACFVYLTDAFRHVDPFEVEGAGAEPPPIPQVCLRVDVVHRLCELWLLHA